MHFEILRKRKKKSYQFKYFHIIIFKSIRQFGHAEPARKKSADRRNLNALSCRSFSFLPTTWAHHLKPRSQCAVSQPWVEEKGTKSFHPVLYSGGATEKRWKISQEFFSTNFFTSFLMNESNRRSTRDFSRRGLFFSFYFSFQGSHPGWRELDGGWRTYFVHFSYFFPQAAYFSKGE